MVKKFSSTTVKKILVYQKQLRQSSVARGGQEDRALKLCLNEIELLRRRLLTIVFMEDGIMDKLFFNGEFTSKGNFRGEDIYQFLDDLKFLWLVEWISLIVTCPLRLKYGQMSQRFR